MHIIFFSTTDVFRAEEILNNADIENMIVPTPVRDRAYCGVCIQTNSQKATSLLEGMEFEIAN